MTAFKDQLEDDLNVFINPDEFGELITYIPDSGNGIPVIDIEVDFQVETGSGLDAKFATVYIKQNDVAEPEYLAVINRSDNSSWYVLRDEDVRPELNFGLWQVPLIRNERGEVS